LHEAAERDPHNPHDDLAYGGAILQFYRDPQMIDIAVNSYLNAVAKYPNYSFAQAGLARALSAAGKPEEAKVAAHRALELDQLNRDLQHYDRLLPDDTIAALRAIDR
jgi:tetratricopeptide (TPR) repeat protein